MILQALHDYYQRLADDPEHDIAPPGFSVQNIGFRVVINEDGSLHAIEATDHDEKGKPRPVKLRVLGQAKPTGAGINPCFLWDNATYQLGAVPEKRDPKWAADRYEKFRTEHLAAEKEIDDPAYSAVCRFLENWSPQHAAAHPDLNPPPANFGVFRLRGQQGDVHQRPKVLTYWQHRMQRDGDRGAEELSGVCAVTGTADQPIARLHEPKIKGIVGGQTTGALLVSFNSDAYESYGKTQSFNAPVSEDAAFRYCTALNYLLADRSRRVIIGDASTVFWTEKPAPIERAWGPMLDDRCAESEEQLKQVRGLLLRIVRGTAPPDALGPPETRFFVLGLSPNAGRIAVRYWFTDTLDHLLTNLREHLQDLSVIGMDAEAPPPVLRELLLETVRDAKDIPPLLAGALARAILTGRPYPEAFFFAVLRRVRTDGEVWPRRAAILKAHLNRLHRERPFLKEPIPMALDITRNDKPYVLGRLFATYEKIQRDALGDKLNRTIKDSYLSSASASPAAVFPRLFRLSQHHLGKIEQVGLRITREKLLGDLYSRVEGFPSHLSHHDQGLFAIGYYHQTQAFYARKTDEAEAKPVEVAA